MLIFSAWNKNLKLWITLLELMQMEVQCRKNYFKNFLRQGAGASGDNTEKVFCKLINFVEKRLIFSHFEGSIIP